MSGTLTYKDAAEVILGQSLAPMHCGKIADKAIEQKLVTTSGKTPRDTMCAQLATDIKKGHRSRFVRTSPSHYALNPDYEAPPGPSKPGPSPKEPGGETASKMPSSRTGKAGRARATRQTIRAVPKMSSSYTGKGGEHLVASRMLFLGYNASIMAVDTGADLIATKGGRTFYIQVKTANLSGNRYRFNIKVGSFEKHASGSVFYIFVIRNGNSTAVKQCEDFLILPYTRIQEYIDRKLIKYILKDTMLDVTIMKEGDGFSLGRKGNEVKFYINNWSLIK